MSGRSAVAALLAIVSMGALVALIASDGQILSARAWFTASGVAVVALVAYDLLRSAPMEPIHIYPLVRLRPRDGDPRPEQSVRSAEIAITRSIADSRIFVHRLRPRLIDLAHHYLQIGAGIDSVREPGRSITHLGDEAWLTSPAFENRAPTRLELERFMDTIGAPVAEPPRPSTGNRHGPAS